MWFSAIMAGIGLVAGIAGAASESSRRKKEAEEQKKYIEEMYKINKEKADEEYAAAKENAERNAKEQELQANLTDKSLDITEKGLGNDFNAAIDQMYLGQEADAYSWNVQAMQAGSQEGAAYANLASTGVRAGSSLSDAVQMESATNAAQLQFSQDAKRRSDNNNLASVLNNLAGNRFGIQQNRIGADLARNNAAYLRNSFQEGGHNYNLDQNQLEQLKKTTDYEVTKANYTIQQNSGSNAFWNAAIGGLQGGVKGFQTGYNLFSTYNDMKGYRG